MRLLTRMVIAALAIVGLFALVAGIALLRGGVSARPAPGAFETRVARRLRSFAIPRDAGERTDPVPPSVDAVRAGMLHFADHCAACHAVDGSGDTEMGRNLYPRAPDMRTEATQALSDGALFYIIENGVRLTGMPAWATGTEEGRRESWQLVQFIRHLPKLTDGERFEMRQWTPRTPAEWRAEEEAERFLAPEGAKAPPAPGHRDKGEKR